MLPTTKALFSPVALVYSEPQVADDPQSDANAGKGSRRTGHAAVWTVLLGLREGCFVICCH